MCTRRAPSHPCAPAACTPASAGKCAALALEALPLARQLERLSSAARSLRPSSESSTSYASVAAAAADGRRRGDRRLASGLPLLQYLLRLLQSDLTRLDALERRGGCAVGAGIVCAGRAAAGKPTQPPTRSAAVAAATAAEFEGSAAHRSRSLIIAIAVPSFCTHVVEKAVDSGSTRPSRTLSRAAAARLRPRAEASLAQRGARASRPLSWRCSSACCSSRTASAAAMPAIPRARPPPPPERRRARPAFELRCTDCPPARAASACASRASSSAAGRRELSLEVRLCCCASRSCACNAATEPSGAPTAAAAPSAPAAAALPAAAAGAAAGEGAAFAALPAFDGWK